MIPAEALLDRVERRRPDVAVHHAQRSDRERHERTTMAARLMGAMRGALPMFSCCTQTKPFVRRIQPTSYRQHGGPTNDSLSTRPIHMMQTLLRAFSHRVEPGSSRRKFLGSMPSFARKLRVISRLKPQIVKGYQSLYDAKTLC